jgi:hypothetical protein
MRLRLRNTVKILTWALYRDEIFFLLTLANLLPGNKRA